MDKRLTKTTIITIIIAVIIIILINGVDTWFGIDLGIFKRVIFAAVIVVTCIIAGLQSAKVEKQSKSK